MKESTLYQFSLCPYCHKVRAGLDLKKVPYKMIEVSPRSKKELPVLPPDAPKKVPVLKVGNEIVYDSSSILRRIDALLPESKIRLVPEGEKAQKRAERLEAWVNDELVQALPAVLYGPWKSAVKAAQMTASASNMGLMQSLGTRVGGSIIMHMIAKRIMKRHGRSDANAWLNEALDKLEEELGQDSFLGGVSPSYADAAAQGVLNCVKPFEAFQFIRQRPRLDAWFKRVETLRA
jgi:glutathione S-transferase